MKIGNKNFNNKTFIIAEIGNNHEGSYKNAVQLILNAAECGVDAVKFQYIIPKLFISPLEKKRIKQLNKFLLPKSDFLRLSKLAKKKGLIFFSSVFDESSIKFFNLIQPIFKIASSDNNYFDLIKKIISYKKPILISLGLLDRNSLKKLDKFLISQKTNKKITLMHCVSSYPVKAEDANLSNISFLKKEYSRYTIGYSDHTLGIEAACCAVAKGAQVIEKHFTLSKKFSRFRDHKISADPHEMKEMVKRIRLIEKFNKESNNLSRDEKNNIKALRRSIYLKKNTFKNTFIKKNDLICLRPGLGVEPNSLKLFVGKKLKKNITSGKHLSLKDI